VALEAQLRPETLPCPRSGFIRQIRRTTARSRAPDDGQPLLRTFIALLSGPDVPDIRFECVLPAADANLLEVADGVLGFGVA